MSGASGTPAEEAADWIALSLVDGLGNEGLRRLLAAFGPPARIFSAPYAALATLVKPEVARAIAERTPSEALQRALDWLGGENNSLLTLADADYPRQLLEISDPPPLLYVKGRRELLSAPSLAIVGSRNATPAGLRTAREFAAALSAAGLAIVSGLALGIDAAAHAGGLDGAGSSIAVLGTGLDIIYPQANRAIAFKLASHGVVVSEFPLGTPAIAGNFPRRNRVISGLARGVLVVEAALVSGSLVTARLAGEQGREVFAIPGSIHSALSKGCHRLIKQGAKLVETAQDVLEELSWAVPAPPVESSPAQRGEETLLAAMGFDPVGIDVLAERTGLTAGELAARLTEAEIDGAIASLPGGLYQRLR